MHSEPAIALAAATRQMGDNQADQQAGTGHPTAIHEVAHQQVLLLGVEARLELTHGLRRAFRLGIQLVIG